jgi:chitinase
VRQQRPNAFKNVIAALRARFGSNNLVTAAITADGTSGGKIDATDYAGAVPNLNWIMPMTYDYFGAFSPQGPTAPHAPLTSYAGIPTAGFYADAAIQKLKSKGIPANKILFGSASTAGAGPASPRPARAARRPVRRRARTNRGPRTTRCSRPAARPPARSAAPRTPSAAASGGGYDNPATIGGKMAYANNQGLGEPSSGSCPVTRRTAS